MLHLKYRQTIIKPEDKRNVIHLKHAKLKTLIHEKIELLSTEKQLQVLHKECQLLNKAPR